MRRSRVWTAAVVLALAACHKDSTGPLGPLDGDWAGSVTGNFAMDLQLTDKGGQVNGSGSLAGPGIVNPPILFSISGSEDGTSFTTTLTATGRSGTVSFTGTITNSTTLTATLDGSGFSNVGIVMSRQ